MTNKYPHFVMYRGYDASDEFDDINFEAEQTRTFSWDKATGSSAEWFQEFRPSKKNTYHILCIDGTQRLLGGKLDPAFRPFLNEAKKRFGDTVFILIKGDPQLKTTDEWLHRKPESFVEYELKGKLFFWEDLPASQPLQTLCDLVVARGKVKNTNIFGLSNASIVVLSFIILLLSYGMYMYLIKLDTEIELGRERVETMTLGLKAQIISYTNHQPIIEKKIRDHQNAIETFSDEQFKIPHTKEKERLEQYLKKVAHCIEKMKTKKEELAKLKTNAEFSRFNQTMQEWTEEENCKLEIK